MAGYFDDDAPYYADELAEPPKPVEAPKPATVGAGGLTGRNAGVTEDQLAQLAAKAGGQEQAIQWLTDNPGDIGRGLSSASFGSHGGTQSPAQAWTSQPQQDPRAAALYQQLLQRSQQSLAVDRNDPAIRQQADAYAANQERAKRNYISDIAERNGPYANIRGEQRLAAERAGTNAASFEAELIGRELTARREEIAQALSSMQGLLTAEQQITLQRELASITAALQEQGLAQSQDQFLRELALREWQAGDTSDLNWASLGA